MNVESTLEPTKQTEPDTEPEKKEKKIKVPHVFALLFFVTIVAAIVTYLIPAGTYDRTTNDAGQTIVVSGTYHLIEQTPVGFLDIFEALFEGMARGSNIIFTLFIFGGAFGILRATGAIEGAVSTISSKMKGREIYLIPVLMTFFAVGGATFGMLEEAIIYTMMLMPFVLRMGFDSILAAAIPLVGTCVGYTAAFMNPFTVGVAQGIVELPLLSGMAPRVVFWFIFSVVGIAYVMIYAKKIKTNPKKSLMYNEDQNRKNIIDTTSQTLTVRQILILVTLLLTMVTLALGVIISGWYFKEMTAIILLMGIIMGILAKMRVNEMTDAFINGCKDLLEGALVVGFAYGVLVVLQNGNVMDTILFGLASFVGGLPSGFSAIGMYISQCILSYIVPSASGMAALSMPIMAPLGDLVGVSRQTAVLAYQFGDGISNIFTPTSGYFMAALAAAGVSWIKWVKWIWPLILIQYVLAAIFITITHLFIWS